MTRTIELNPRNAWAFERRGTILHEKKEYEAAIRDFGKAIQMRPRQAAFFYSRGRAYGAQGDQDRAIHDFDRAIELRSQEDPCSFTVYAARDDYYERGVA